MKCTEDIHKVDKAVYKEKKDFELLKKVDDTCDMDIASIKNKINNLEKDVLKALEKKELEHSQSVIASCFSSYVVMVSLNIIDHLMNNIKSLEKTVKSTQKKKDMAETEEQFKELRKKLMEIVQS